MIALPANSAVSPLTGKARTTVAFTAHASAVIALPELSDVGNETGTGLPARNLIPFSKRMIFTGTVAEPGYGHFSKYRPKFYRAVLDLSGVALREGTINVRIDGEMPRFPLPDTQRVPGQDQIDFEHNQDILITPCAMEGRQGSWSHRGFWILPVFKGTWEPNPKGHFPKHIIEVSLAEELRNVAPGLNVSLEIPGGR